MMIITDILIYFSVTCLLNEKTFFCGQGTRFPIQEYRVQHHWVKSNCHTYGVNEMSTRISWEFSRKK